MDKEQQCKEPVSLDFIKVVLNAVVNQGFLDDFPANGAEGSGFARKLSFL